MRSPIIDAARLHSGGAHRAEKHILAEERYLARLAVREQGARGLCRREARIAQKAGATFAAVHDVVKGRPVECLHHLSNRVRRHAPLTKIGVLHPGVAARDDLDASLGRQLALHECVSSAPYRSPASRLDEDASLARPPPIAKIGPKSHRGVVLDARHRGVTSHQLEAPLRARHLLAHVDQVLAEDAPRTFRCQPLGAWRELRLNGCRCQR